jgi:hypothetical protein
VLLANPCTKRWSSTMAIIVLACVYARTRCEPNAMSSDQNGLAVLLRPATSGIARGCRALLGGLQFPQDPGATVPLRWRGILSGR